VAHPLFLAGRPLWLEAEALLRAGQPERAREYVAGWGRAIHATPRASLDHARAVAALHQFAGRPAQVVAALQPAAGLAARLGLPGEHWQILAALARAHAAAGEAPAAALARAQAWPIVEQLAASLEAGVEREAFRNGATLLCREEPAP
jgi:hypothetical protein